MSDIASNERLRRISLLAALVVPMVTACGGGSGGSAETPATPAPEPVPTTAQSLLAGNTNGTGNQDGAALTTARFSLLGGMAATSSGEIVIADSNLIRKLSANQEQVSTLAGGGGPVPSGVPSNYADGNIGAARFYGPKAVAVDAAGNTYVADTQNHLVRKISTSGTVTTLAGKVGVCGNQDGSGSDATLCSPGSVAVDKGGNVYVSEIKREQVSGDIVANPIRKITPTGEVTTLTNKASVYPHTSISPFTLRPVSTYYPVRLAIDSAGTLHAADPNDNVIRKYAADGQGALVSGTPYENNEGDTDGAASSTKFRYFQAIAFDAEDRLVLLVPDDSGYPAIRRVDKDGTAKTLMRAQSCGGINAGQPGSLCTATQLIVKADGDFLVAEYGSYRGLYTYAQLRSYTPQGVSTAVAGVASAEGTDDGQGGSARFNNPGALAFNPSGSLYVRDNSNSAIRTVQADGLVRTLGKPDGHYTAVTGMAGEFIFGGRGLAADGAGNLYTIYVNQGVQILKMSNCQAMLFADIKPLLGTGPASFLSSASGITADSTGNVYVSTLNGAIFKINTKGEIALFAGAVGTAGHADGQGAAARFSTLGNMTIDAAGNVYVVDGLYYSVNKVGPTIRKITPSGLVSTLAGNPNAKPGYADGAGTAAFFTVSEDSYGTATTASIAVDNQGNVYVSDFANSVIRKIAVNGQVSTPVGQAWRYGFAAGDLPGIINRPAGIAVRGSMMYITVPNAVIQVKLP
ncbi:hypothetical protein LJR074_003820 [Acidovorax sp. LjRoot74]|uniref:hypothetical protein n=1 Tax=Acidovorax sp. LjRoot74 TaxID=3342337 RepID=UPI003ECC4152